MARLLSTLPVGAKVVETGTKYNDKPITWLVGGHDHYAQGQTALVSEKIITLKAFDAKEVSNSNSSRQSYGNNRYLHSNLRQWLNSNEASWYSAQHSADAPPTNENVWSNNNEYDQEKGFLANFSANMRDALIPTALTVAKNTITDGGGSETVTDKVFLLSNTEVGLTNENGIVEGKRLALFTTADNSRLAYPTTEAVSKSEYKDTTSLTTSKAWYYWLRSPHTGYSNGVRFVHSSGALNGDNAYSGYHGVRPALNLPSNVVVSDTPNSNGEYELILESPKTRKLQELPVGAKVVEPGTKYNGAPITWLVGGHDHYAQGQTALVSEKSISLKAFDAKEASNTDSKRKDNGNNRYSVSNIRQWLNSSKTSWYTPQHSADAPPTNENVWSGYNDYDTEAGFLTNFSTGMKSALVAVPLITAKNTVTDGGGSEVVNDKVFLLSNTEVGLANENSIAEGKLLPLFSNDASRVAYPTAEAVTKSEYKDATNLVASKPWLYWLRSPRASLSNIACLVNTSGALVNGSAYDGGNGVRPALNLLSNILVSGTPNSSGEYEIIISTIETSGGTELGSIRDNTSILKYTPRDYPVGTTVIEKINGVVVGTKTIVNDTEYTVSATTAQWGAIKYGKYKDTLGNKNVVTLEVSNGDIYARSFTKTLPTTAKTNDVLIAVNDMTNTSMPSHKKKLVDAIGNKATIGGNGTLENIAKAVSEIGIESLNGVPCSVQSISRDSTTKPFPDANGSPTSQKFIAINTSALPFVPSIIVIKPSHYGAPTLWMKEGVNNETGTVTVSYSNSLYQVPYNSSVMYLPVNASIDNTQVYKVYIYGG